ncbi:MAG TPA: hypothetical protein PKX99_04420 [Thermoanaerobaculia bacterium]|nr:hypothetical protein [Thermoanaerobaculia bacterium]
MSDRKYRQRGYQDDDRPPAGQRKPAPRRGDEPPKPRGRGLGMPTATIFRCAACGRPAAAPPDAFDDVCASCGAALHTCTNCRHFDSTAPRECRQPVAERVAKKAAANRCELFAPRLAQEFAREETRPSDDPRAAFDALFKL